MNNTVQTTTRGADRVHYSLTQKESESGMGFNIRLLVLVQQKYFGYIREKDIDKKNLQASVNLNNVKKKILLKDIRKIISIKEKLTIMINQIGKNQKLASLKWVFKMANEELADSWQTLLNRQTSPNPSRKTTQQKQKDQRPKNPSIKEIVRNAEDMAKSNLQKQKVNTSQKKQFQKSKQIPVSSSSNIKQPIRQIKQPEKIKQKQIPPQNPMKSTKMKQQLIPYPPRQQGPNNQRQSELTFSFKGHSEQNDNYSPPKKQSIVLPPHPVLQKIKKMEENLSSHLEEKVDLKLVEKQVLQHKKERAKQPINPSQFRRLESKLTNRQKQIQNMSFLNYFRQVMGQIDDKMYKTFYSFCEIKIRELLIQNFEDQNSLQSWTQYISLKNAVKVEIIPTQLKQIPGNSSICDEGLLKSYLNKFKNADYIWKSISKEKTLTQVFLLPMSCIVEYQGVVAYFTCMFTQTWNSPTQKTQDFSMHFEQLASLTKMNKTTFQNSSAIKFSRHSGSQFVISQVKQYLPRLLSINCQLRPQMFEQVSAKTPQSQQQSEPTSRNNTFIKSNRKEQQKYTKYYKEPIEQSIRNLSRSMNRIEEYVLHPSQFSKLVHLYGLNIMHMAELYKNIENVYMRGIIKTQAVLRSIKIIYRKKMQETLISTGETEQDKEQQLVRLTKAILNILLSKSEQSDKLWEMVILHTQVNFKLVVEKEDLNKGYLFLGLEHHLNLRIKTQFRTCDKMFTTDSFIDSIEFTLNIKPCQLYWLNEEIYQSSLEDIVNSLMVQLELREKGMPFYIYQDKNTLNKIYDILCLYYDPNSTDGKNLKLYAESEYSSDQTLFYYRRKIAQIKWMIKLHTENIPANGPDHGANRLLYLLQVQQKIEKLKEDLSFYFGIFHPFYSQFHDILITIYEKERNYEKVEQYSKQSLTNILQLCGGNTMHIKLSNNYYQKGEMCSQWGRVDEAINNYKKAKSILEYNEYVESKQYAIVELRLAELYLNRFKDADAGRMLESCFRVFCKIVGVEVNLSKKYPQGSAKGKSKRQEVEREVEPTATADEQQEIYKHLVICLQLLNRCSAAAVPDKSSTLVSYSLTVLQNFLQPSYPLHPIQLPDPLTLKLLKILIENYFISQSKKISQEFFQYVEQICDELHVAGNKFIDPTICLNFLKQMVINKALLENLAEFRQKAAASMLEAKRNPGLIKSGIKNAGNKGLENFQTMMRSVVVSLGEGYLLGILNDQSN